MSTSACSADACVRSEHLTLPSMEDCCKSSAVCLSKLPDTTTFHFSDAVIVIWHPKSCLFVGYFSTRAFFLAALSCCLGAVFYF